MVGAIDVILGFDPGGKGKPSDQGGDGKGKFGWSICRIDSGQLWVFDTGRAINAKCALEQVIRALPKNARVQASGIDAPMFWTYNWDRKADRAIIREMKERGHPNPSSTVQHINRLSGACLAQGILLGRLLHGCRRFDAAITEAHPKALLYLLGLCRSDLGELVQNTNAIEPPYKEDKQDAVLAAYAAWSMLEELQSPSRSAKWRNLLEDEKRKDLFFPFDTTVDVSVDPLPVSYWMPIRKKSSP